MNDAPAGPVIDPAVEAAIGTRRSVRGFTDRPVPRAVVRHILELSSRAPSMTNTQPWRVHVMTGEPLAGFKAELCRAHREGQHWDAEYPYYPSEWVPPYIDRRRQIGWALYGLLGIAKGDREASARQHEKNFAFFGAPVGMIITASRVLQTGSYLDIGMFLENIMIAARGYGLDTCPQAAFAFLHPLIRRRLAVPDNELVVCGMALGYADPAEPANALKTVRAEVDAFATFEGED